MDTKLKKLNSRIWFKGLCIFISFVMMFGACATAANVVITAAMYQSNYGSGADIIFNTEDVSYTSLNDFQNEFSQVLYNLNLVANDNNNKAYNKALADQKDAQVEKQLKEYNKTKTDILYSFFISVVTDYNQNKDAYDAYYSDIGYKDIGESIPTQEVKHRVDIDSDAPLIVRHAAGILNGINEKSDVVDYYKIAYEMRSCLNNYGFFVDSDYGVGFSPYFEISDDNQYTDNDNYDNKVDYFISTKSAKKKLTGICDSFIKLSSRQTADEDTIKSIQQIKGIHYYVKSADSTVVSNLPNGDNFDSLLNYDVCYSSDSTQTKGLNQFWYSVREDCNYNNNNYDEAGNSIPFTKGTVAYVAVDDYDTLLSADATGDDSGSEVFVSLAKMHSANQMQNYLNQIIIASVMLLISIAMLIVVLVGGGRVAGYDGIKCSWIDKLPTDLHLVVSGAIIFALVVCLAPIIDSYDYWFDGLVISRFKIEKSLITLLFGAIFTGIWIVFTEFSCSFIRVCKSPKHLYKNCLIYMVLYGIWRLIARIFNKIRSKRHPGRIKKSFTRLIDTLSYSPKAYKRNMIIVFMLYLLANIALVLITVAAVATNSAFFTFVFIAALIVGNGVVVGFIFRYLVNLDKIITAASLRQFPDVDYVKLPKSLKTLADSIKYTNDELQNLITKAVKDEQMKAALITNVSHDLKTPLTSIITYIDLLSKCNIKNQKALDYISVLNEKGENLKRLIEDLIEASKVSTGSITLNITNINLSELAAQAIGENQSEFEKNNLELIWTDNSNSSIINADGSKTYRIIENLLSNAKKYSAKGSRVYAGVFNDGANSVFEIKNISAQPLNISPDELTERFVRGDESRNKEGNGLGLSIAKELCIAQNGRLELSIDGDLFKARMILPNSSTKSSPVHDASV